MKKRTNIAGIWRRISMAALMMAGLLAAGAGYHDAQAACTAPAAPPGALIYNQDIKITQYCAGTTWRALSLPGTGSGGCANPATTEGGIIFNPDLRTFQVCGGNTWRALSPLYGTSHWQQVTINGMGGCGLLSNGEAMCWGSNKYGMFGNPAYTASAGPVPVSTSGVTGNRWIWLYSGDSFNRGTTCGIRDDGTGYCWGQDMAGQLGDGGTSGSYSSIPVALDLTGVTGTAWAHIYTAYDNNSSSAMHNCGIRDDGTGYCWGSDGNGQLGNGATTGNQLRPSPISTAGISGTAWVSLSPGSNYTCGLRDDGTAWCWGYDGYQNLGNGSISTTQTAPVAVSTAGVGGTTWIDIKAGGYTTCGLRDNDTMWCWGRDMSVGYTSTGYVNRDTPRLVSGTWSEILNPDRNVCGINQSGAINCFGYVGESSAYKPVWLEQNKKWIDIDTDLYANCAIQNNGTGYCWGGNWNGNLGTGDYEDLNLPSVPLTCVWKDLDMGGEAINACGIKTDGTGWCWGAGWSGQLGQGSYDSEASPVPISGTNSWKHINPAVGYEDVVCGIKTDGTAWCWGDDYGYGILGINNPDISNIGSPIQLGGQWKRIDVGQTGACGIDSRDRLQCWGDGYFLGAGYSGLESTPQPSYCGAPTAQTGTIIFDSSSNRLHYCDGVAWSTMSQ